MEKIHVYDLIPEYALGVLDENEVVQVEEHLKACEACRVELQNYQRVVDELPLVMKLSSPPANLKDRVMASALEDRRIEEHSRSPSVWVRLRGSLLGAAPIWGTVSLALVVVLVFSNLLLWQRVGQLESANHDDLITLALHGTDITPDAAGMLVMSEDGDYGVLVVDGLPQLSEEQQYQLWLIHDGQRTSGGVFSVNEGGYGSLLVSSNQPLIIYNAFGITVEPAGGSPGPTGDKVLGGEV